MNERELVCIVCPLGCHLNVQLDEKKKETKVTGNQCARGEMYGREETLNPKRVITSTVKIKGAQLVRLPVKTKGAISKALIFEAMKVIRKVEVTAPVVSGQVIIEDILHTGVDVVASRGVNII